jgi:hypothetical protein
LGAIWRAVDTNILDVADGRCHLQERNRNDAAAPGNRKADMRHTRASPQERDLVLTHVTRLQSRPVVIGVRCCVLMFVSGRSVAVLGMVVFGVRVHVPHGALPRDRQQG